MSGHIHSLTAVADANLGGKAYGLSRLLKMNLSVPPAFIIQNARIGDYPEDLDEHFESLAADAVAVRSSATGEDGIELSFAGQYESVLGVRGISQLREAIDHCVASASSDRAIEYQTKHTGGQQVAMNVIVQSMVDARVAGVVFTADPVSARRDLLIVDAVGGLGEALVSGEATPDHYAVNTHGEILRRQLVGEKPLLSDSELAQIVEQARSAARHEGCPLDLEWAIDHTGGLYWLQARPITTLPSDLNEFDTSLPRSDDVLTISNVSEMMPGAVCPLTMSFTGWGIDYGLQHMQVAVGARDSIDKKWQITASAYGHLFLNLTGNVVLAAGVLGSTAAQTAQTLCGRVVPELKELPPLPFLSRLFNTGRLLRYCLQAPSVVDNFDLEMAQFSIEHLPDSRAMWHEIQHKAWFFEHAMAVHIQSSALSGFLSSIVENMVSGTSNESTIEEQAEAVRLLAGAEDVESAVMLQELDALIDQIATRDEVESRFRQATVEAAGQWLRSAPGLAEAYRLFLRNHGHRGYRELCMRDQTWADNQEPLIRSMQAAVQSRLVVGEYVPHASNHIDWAALNRGLRWVLPKAHNAIRRREHTKSQLVRLAHNFKKAFYYLGHQLTEEGGLPDADLVFFLTMSELSTFVETPEATVITVAELRRHALNYQQLLQFPEISVGLPQPTEPQAAELDSGVLHGRPAACGQVEGYARIALTLEEAAELEPGEILITPITDIGWTPYFSLIGGLVTDLGSSVSHGAVIAREYGLPCIVNSRQATQLFRTGDRVRLDGDTGTLSLLSDQ